MNAPTKARDFLDPIKEAQAVAAMREAYGIGDDDEDLLADVIEGQTSLHEVFDLILGRIRDAEIIVEGIEAVSADLDLRKRRAADGIKRDRSLIEQAMTIAELDKVVRPTATLSLRINQPTVTVIEEADIPADFFVRGDPKLDKKALNAAVLAHAAAMQIEDDAERAAALAEAPEIKGVTLSNGAPSVTIRSK
jgi:hypothetical protein